uniref:NF-kappa-B inhibitor alpha-like n=1 Tax=Myxine glutinosa TaxID=7769 RepID=UPI00358DF44C
MAQAGGSTGPAKEEKCDSGIASFSEVDILDQIQAGVAELELARGPGARVDDACLGIREPIADDDGDTILHQAIIHEVPVVAQEIIYRDVHRRLLDVQNDLKQTPLHLAVVTEQTTIVVLLLRAGVSLELQDWQGNTPLHLASGQRSLDGLLALTSDAQDRHHAAHDSLTRTLEIHNYNGHTCLHEAVFACNYDIVKYLLELGSDINAQDPKSGRTALHFAVELHRPTLVEILAKKNADINASTYSGCTPLHLAVGRGAMDLAVMLLASGADAGLRNMEQDSAFDLAGSNEELNILSTYDDLKIGGQPVF